MSDWLDPLLTRTDDSVGSSASAAGDKRALIVEAALDVLLSEGIGKLSMRRVARQAGVALGLAHYYFASKGELIAALTGASGRRLRAENLSPSAGEVSESRAWLGGSGWLVAPDRVRLLADIDSAAMRDPVVAKATAQHHRDAESEIYRQLQAIAGAVTGEPDELMHLSAVLSAALDGLAVRALIDPSFDLSAAHAMLHRLLQPHLAAQAGEAARLRVATSTRPRTPPKAMPCGTVAADSAPGSAAIVNANERNAR